MDKEISTLLSEIKKFKADLLKLDENYFYSIIGKDTPALLVDLETGIILQSTVAAEILFGYQMEGALVDMNIKDLMPERFRTIHDTHLKKFRDNPAPRNMGEFSLDTIGLTSDGKEFPVEIGLRAKKISGRALVIATLLKRR